VVILGALISAGCSALTGGGSLEKPSQRLVGHWAFEEGEVSIQWYFGPVDPKTNRGVHNSLSSFVPGRKVADYQFYRILSEDINGEDIRIQIFTDNGNCDPLPIKVSKPRGTIVADMYNSITKEQHYLTMKYVDSAVSP